MSNMPSHEHSSLRAAAAQVGSADYQHPLPTRRTSAGDGIEARRRADSDASATDAPPKETVFKLVVSEDQSQYARLPLRIRVNKRDDTQSIIDTVKAFFGLPDSMGVSFEDSDGYKIIPQYDNFVAKSSDSGELAVRVILEPVTVPAAEMVPIPSIPSPAPAMSPLKLEDIPRPNGFDNMYGGSDAGSVTSSRRDNLASADISVENIVEGGRRKRTKFESSALPLFNPPQIPASASLSSISPQRRLTNTGIPSPLPSNQYTFSYGQPLLSPMSHNASDKGFNAAYSNGTNGSTPAHGATQGHRLRARASGSLSTPRMSATSINGIMPTPAPTISSAMSDEDVALQLIRLGDPNNLSLGRTSTSTMDDALSGKADAASSDEDDVDESSLLVRKRTSSMAGFGKGKKKKLPKLQTNTGHGREEQDSEEYSEEDYEGSALLRNKAGKSGHSRALGAGSAPRPKASGKAKSRQMSGTQEPGSHLVSGRESIASSVNSPSNLGPNDEDLSMLPRCQRCRKSKKGCDRQRPCGRCKDAGIGIEGCISEDEGNGRKGRFGRHMGVPVKTSADGISPLDEGVDVALAADSDGGKKRKK